ncbi:class I SAM-dependent methyltransferase [Thermogemmatispora sp.]|uniref:class I SAM-dependent methyltransferase n=1 Tax=Thermogemmatispora sp. TaxID=1968838 RepID=UPI001DC83D2A|nr:SAM-dependent methyltransferase [Thermogemmatispora sp.]MBX5450256.1 SAM-dependent methyltransferase [Thermogemmatispora sp.]
MGDTQEETRQRISVTAHLTAAARAYESRRPDHLFDDPLAALLASSEGFSILEKGEDKGGSIIVRTRYFDEWLERLTHEEGIRQIVLPAAGLDTRAFRLDWPAKTCFYEIDLPHVVEYKESVLQFHQAQPRCQRVVLAADLLSAPWESHLVEAGFDPALPSIWLVEGLFFYIPLEQTCQLLARLSRLAAPGSWLGFDAIHSAMLSSPLTSSRIQLTRKNGAPWIGAIDDPVALLATFGWQASFIPNVRKGYEYGREIFPFVPPEALNSETEKLYHMLVTAKRLSEDQQT